MGECIVASFSGHSNFGQDCEIETTSVSLFGLRRHLVHDPRQLIQTAP
jgi:hypothetical protein